MILVFGFLRVGVTAFRTEGVLGQGDAEAQALACSVTFLGVILNLQPRTSLMSSKYGNVM